MRLVGRTQSDRNLPVLGRSHPARPLTKAFAKAVAGAVPKATAEAVMEAVAEAEAVAVTEDVIANRAPSRR